MTWLRFLGDESVPEPLRGELWRRRHPDLAPRIANLLEALEAAGIAPDRWPHPPETAAAGPFQLGMMTLKATDGYEAMIEALERRWASDRRNPAHQRRHGPGPLPGSDRAELQAIRDELQAAEKPHGYASVGKVAGVSASTVRRRFGTLT